MRIETHKLCGIWWLAMRLGIWKIPLVSRRIKPVRHVRAYLVDRFSCSCKRTGIATLRKKKLKKKQMYEPDCHRRRPKNYNFGPLLLPPPGGGTLSCSVKAWRLFRGDKKYIRRPLLAGCAGVLDHIQTCQRQLQEPPTCRPLTSRREESKTLNATQKAITKHIKK